MSDLPNDQAYPPPPPAMPPPPPPNAPPPVYQGQAYAAPPPPVSYQPSQPGYAYPGQMPQPINPVAVGFGGSAALLSQFSGFALSSIIAGLLSAGVPLLLNRYYIILPVLGIVSGLRAIQRGKLIGGLVGIGLNVLGGIFTLFGLGVLGGGGT